jgi:hypothetical protein
VPNGDVFEAAKELKPELANADDDVCGLSLSPLPNVGLDDNSGDFLDVLESAGVVLVVSEVSCAVCSDQ